MSKQKLNTGPLRTTDSDSNGEYVPSNLPAGHYEVRVTMRGSKTWVLPDIELQVNQHATADAAL